MKRLHTFLILLSTALMCLLLLFAASCGGTKSVTLRFSAEGADVPSVTAEAGAEVRLPTPAREGYAFGGWYLDADLSGEKLPDTIPAPNRDTTYYGKWLQGYRLTLDFGGGAFNGANTATLWLAEGQNVSAALQDILPAKNGLPFGAWFLNGEPISSDLAMQASELSLVARYLVGYRIDVRLQNVSGSSYVLDEAKTQYFKGYAGVATSPEAPAIENFLPVENADGVTTLTLSESEADNVFTFFYDRARYAVTYDAAAPEGSAEGVVLPQEAAYGASIRTAENGFEVHGYRFAGWSTVRGGEVEYASNARLTVNAPVTLYAVWDRGYTDRFGGSDLIFFPRDDEDVAILLRGKHEFKGVRSGDSFTFERGSEELTGSVFGLTFCFAHSEVKGEYVLYDCTNHPQLGLGGKQPNDPSRIDSSVTLTVDEYLGAVYKTTSGEEKGTVCASERGDYLFTGENGTTFYLQFEGETEDKELPARFSICGDEANIYVEGMIFGNQVGAMDSSLVLDGYGTAVLYLSSGLYNLGYDGFYQITNKLVADGQSMYRGRVMYRVQVTIFDPIGAINGEENSWVDNVVFTIPEMFMSDQGVANGYVSADVYRGEYTGTGDENGNTLTLDGIGRFDDSAVYEKGNQTVKGTYSYTVDRKMGLVVTVKDSSNHSYRYQADPATRTFKSYAASETKDKYVELYRATGQLDYPMLYLYPNQKEGNGCLAELYATEDDGRTVELAGKGSYTTNDEGGITFYTFTLTSSEEKFDGKLPTHLRFFISEVYSAEDNLPRKVYCVLEEGDEKMYTEYKAENGETILASNEVTLQGIGSLLRRTDGTYLEGSASLTHSTWFGVDTLSFLYAGVGGRAAELRYTVGVTASGNTITLTTSRELTLYYYLYLEEEHRGIYVNDLVLDGTAVQTEEDASGRARFNDDYGDGVWQEGVYTRIGTTEFGDDVFELTVGGTVRFRFVLYRIENDDVYFRYDERLHGTFTSQSGEKLKLDGYFYGSYTDKSGYSELGTFSYLPAQSLLFFTMEDGNGFYCKMENGSFTVLDGAFGSYDLIDSNYASVNSATITFDGLGNVTVTFADGEQEHTGTYRTLNERTHEYLVNCNFGEDTTMPQDGWHVRLLFGTYADGCIVYAPEMVGTFWNDAWDVLYLDGFGTGSLYSADGKYGGEGEYTVMDKDKGLIYFTFDDQSDVSLRFDRAHSSFEIMDFSQYGYLYLADDFDYIVFADNGVLQIGNVSGMYFYSDETIFGYLYDYDKESYSPVQLPLPGADSYEYSGKTYKLWNGEEMTLNGTVEFRGKDGELLQDGTRQATIRLTPKVGANYNMDVSVTVTGDKETYIFTLNPYTEGKLAPRLTYDGVDYSVTFTMGSTNQFTVKAGYYDIVMDDYYSNFRNEDGARRGGRIVKSVVGFGPIVIQKPTYSGYFLYHNNDTPTQNAEVISFTGVSKDALVQVGYRVGGLDECYEIVFDWKGKKYAVDFYESYAEEKGPCIVLQGFYTYEEFKVGTDRVGVKYLVCATTPNTAGYADKNAVGKAYSVTLWRGGAEKPVVCYDTGVSINGDAVWLGEYKGLNEDGTIVVGKGYYVSFTLSQDASTPNKVTAVDVKEYEIGQVNTGAYLINFFTDEDGNVAQILAVAYTDGSGFYWIEKTHGLEYDEDTGVWTFYGTPGNSTETKYTLKFSRTETGKYLVTVTAE